MSQKRFDSIFTLLLGVATCVAAGMLFTHLGHPSLKGLDESFHAVVAEHIIAHPLMPIFYERPFLELGLRDWQFDHIWLHKPPVALWQMAAAMAIGGINTLAMRVPSVVMLCGAAWMTFFTLRRLAGAGPAVVAAIIQLFLPATWMLAYGYAFSDHVDLAMLFWTQASMLLLIRSVQTRRFSDAAWCGVLQGIAWLTKSHPAFIVTGVAFCLWLLPILPRFAVSPVKLSGRQLLTLAATTLLTVLPWTLYTAIAFPQEFAVSQGMILHHLTRNVENFAAPWDRLLFDYLPQLNLQFLPIGLAAMVVLTRGAWRTRNVLWLMPVVWWIGFIVPHVLAVAKTPSQTTPAVPALVMTIGLALLAAWQDRFALATLLTAVLLAVGWRMHPVTGATGYPPDYHFGAIAVQNIGVFVQPLIAVAFGAAWIWFAKKNVRDDPLRPRVTKVGVGLTVTGLAVLVVLAAEQCWRVTRIVDDGLALRQIGPFVRDHLQPNAMLLVEEKKKLERTTVMFYCDRNAYSVTPGDVHSMSERISKSGGIPYLLTARDLPLPVAIRSVADGRTLYRIPQP